MRPPDSPVAEPNQLALELGVRHATGLAIHKWVQSEGVKTGHSRSRHVRSDPGLAMKGARRCISAFACSTMTPSTRTNAMSAPTGGRDSESSASSPRPTSRRGAVRFAAGSNTAAATRARRAARDVHRAKYGLAIANATGRSGRLVAEAEGTGAWTPERRGFCVTTDGTNLSG